MSAESGKFEIQKHFNEKLAPLLKTAPFTLLITQWKDTPIPVLVVKERVEVARPEAEEQSLISGFEVQKRGVLVERGHIVGESQRRCLPILRKIAERVTDSAGIPLELQRYLTQEGLKTRGSLPMDEEAGAKFSLIFRLQERVKELDRVELITRRVARFTREEALYWLSRTTSFGQDSNRWAIAGLRIMLGGQPNDAGVDMMLTKLRND